MSGRAASTDRIPGSHAISVGLTDMPAPRGWEWVRLTDIADLESGHTPSRRHPEYWDGPFQWIGIADAREHHGRRIMQTRQTVTQAGLDNSAARLLPTDTVCLSRTASVGYVVVMGAEMATSQDFVNWVLPHGIEPEFLKYLLMSERESLRRFGKGTTHTTIYYPEVKALHVCLPGTAEQARTVEAVESCLTRLDDATATLERVQANLKRYRASVLRAAVEGRLVPTEAELARQEGREYEPASVLLERILVERRRRWEEAEVAKMEAKGKPPKNDKWKAKYKEPAEPDTAGLPELPEGWCWATVDQLISEPLANGRSVPTAHQGFPVLRLTCLGDGKVDLTQRKMGDWTRDQAARYIVREGDFLVSRGNGSLRLVGRGSVVIAPDEVAFPDTIIRVRVSDVVVLRYFALAWASLPVRAQIERRAKTTAGIYKVSQGDLSEVVVPLPPRSEQGRIQQWMAATEGETAAAQDAVQLAGRRSVLLRQSILKWAFEGKLVDQDPNDEPASVLLERIKSEREAAATEAKAKKKRARRKRKAKK